MNDSKSCGESARGHRTSGPSGVALLVVAVVLLLPLSLASGAGCAAPSFGEEPQGLGRDRSAEPASSSVGQRPSADAGKVASALLPLDAGPDVASPPKCTDTGAVQVAGHCYFALAEAVSWDGAVVACLAKGGHLATIASASEQTAAASVLSTEERWIGLRRPVGSAIADASYAWVNGEARGFQSWSTSKNEPDGSCPTCTVGVVAECGRLLANGEWADDACTVQHPAVCERD